MIKRFIPIRLITKLINFYPKSECVNYRTREGKNLLHFAMQNNNLEAVKVLLPLFNCKSFYLRSNDGTYAQLEVLKSQNKVMKDLVLDYL